MSDRRAAGWVGWEGCKEQYSRSDGPPLTLGVASGSRCPHLCSLHAGSVWNGAVRLAQLIEDGWLRHHTAGKRVLELGAGAALPSLVLLSQPNEALPAAVVISDYDDPAIVEAMSDNLKSNAHLLRADRCRVVGHTWGSDTAALAMACDAALGGTAVSHEGGSFDVVLLAEVMWNPELHRALLQTLCAVLAPNGEVWMCHCHHWDGHEQVDAHFFRLARDRGLVAEIVHDLGAEMACIVRGLRAAPTRGVRMRRVPLLTSPPFEPSSRVDSLVARPSARMSTGCDALLRAWQRWQPLSAGPLLSAGLLRRPRHPPSRQ